MSKISSKIIDEMERREISMEELTEKGFEDEN